MKLHNWKTCSFTECFCKSLILLPAIILLFYTCFSLPTSLSSNHASLIVKLYLWSFSNFFFALFTIKLLNLIAENWREFTWHNSTQKIEIWVKKGTKKTTRQLISIYIHSTLPTPLQYTLFWNLTLFQKLNTISFYTTPVKGGLISEGFHLGRLLKNMLNFKT